MITTVGLYSPHFPIRGASNGSGVDYGLALAYVAAPTIEASRPVTREIRERYGDEAYVKLHRLLSRAILDGRLIVARWRAVA